MEPTKDLNAALSFVFSRVEEQASRTGEPLSEQQRLLLRYLPTHAVSHPHTGYVVLVPRNRDLERLCAMAKEAYSNDRTESPLFDWEFALAVFNLNRHPMAGVLLQAGVRYRRPWWDRVLLVAAALLVIAGGMVPIFLLGTPARPSYEFAASLVGSAVILTLAYLGYRRIADSQLRQEIERCRNESGFNRATD